MATHKFCTLCGRELPLESFPTNRGMPDGHLGKCFECWAMFTSDKMRVLAMAERKQVEPKIEPIEVIVPTEVEKPKRKRVTESEKAEHRKVYLRKYYVTHHDRCTTYQRRYYRENREKSMAWRTKYNQSDKGKEANKRAREAYYARMKSDPERWQAFLEKRKRYRAEKK